MDNAATTPLLPEVAEKMFHLLKSEFGNPSSIHSLGRKTKTLVENARKEIANYLEVKPGEIFFTSGGTEADNMVLSRAFYDLGVNHFISSEIEHHAVLHAIDYLKTLPNPPSTEMVKLKDNGHVDLAALEEALAEAAKAGKKTLVSLMHANNELGNLLPLKEVGEICNRYGAIFHSDTVQTIGYLPIKPKEVGLHFLAASAHKFNGPKGVGFVYIDNDLRVKPFIYGGSQERNMRGGTENVAGIIGMAEALKISVDQMEEKKDHIKALKDYMINQLQSSFENIRFNGDTTGASHFTVLSVSFPKGNNGEMLLFNLDIEGICVSGGSACSSGSDIGSHVLAALNHPADYVPVRFSFGKHNTKAEVDTVIEKLKTILKV